jgi:hypothetical protein
MGQLSIRWSNSSMDCENVFGFIGRWNDGAVIDDFPGEFGRLFE